MAKNNYSTETAEDELPEHRGICLAHSGLTAKLNGGLVLLITIVSMLGFQTFYQVPQLKYDVNQEITTIKAEIVALKKMDADLKDELAQVENLSDALNTDISALTKSVKVNTGKLNHPKITFMDWLKGGGK